MAAFIVDTPALVKSFLVNIESMPTNPPSLYLDLEGGNDGPISILQIYHLPRRQVYLIDVFVLKEAAFNTENGTGTTLRSVLESPATPKVFFAVDHDSEALYVNYNIKVQGIHDVQILEFASRRQDKLTHLSGLIGCIEKEAGLPPATIQKLKAMKKAGHRLMFPRPGGSPFTKRPMSQKIIDYCSMDVEYLPVLWKVYTRRCDSSWLQWAHDKTGARILDMQQRADKNAKKRKANTLTTGTEPDRKRKRADKPVTTVIVNRKKIGEIELSKTGVWTLEEITNAARELAKTNNGGRYLSLADDAPRQPQRQLAGRTNIRISQSSTVTFNYNTPSSKAASSGTTNINDHGQFTRLKAGVQNHQMWTCNVCNRTMQKTQQQSHLAGKPHLSQLKLNEASVSSPKPIVVKKDSCDSRHIKVEM